MAPPRILPPTDQLMRWVEAGYTHEQITDLIYTETGHRVSRSTVSVALHRAGKTTPQDRFDEELPWTVRAPHLARYPARMLRALARRRRDLPLSESEGNKLDRWVAKLSEHNIVVAYDPDSDAGFFYVPVRGDDGQGGDSRSSRHHAAPCQRCATRTRLIPPR